MKVWILKYLLILENSDIVIVRTNYIICNYQGAADIIYNNEYDCYIIEKKNIEKKLIEKQIPDFEKYYNKIIIKNLCNDYTELFKNYENNLYYANQEISQIKKQLIDLNNKKTKLSLLLSAKQNVKNIENKIKREIELIKSHKNFKDITINSNCIFISVKDIIIYEDISNKYYWLGEAVIKLNFGDGLVTFYPGDNEHLHTGYWGDEQIHPHVSLDGAPCLGDSDATLAVYLSEKEYYSAYITAVNFLKSVNVEDIAGYAVSYWDECDKEGNIITLGHCPKENEYDFYSDDYSYYARHYCSICGEYNYDEVEELEIPNGIIWVCENCRENYVYCEDTERYVHIDNAFEFNDKYYENKIETGICDICGDEYLIENLEERYINGTYTNVCYNCENNYCEE